MGRKMDVGTKLIGIFRHTPLGLDCCCEEFYHHDVTVRKNEHVQGSMVVVDVWVRNFTCWLVG